MHRVECRLSQRVDCESYVFVYLGDGLIAYCTVEEWLGEAEGADKLR